jgi:hypothetical protein
MSVSLIAETRGPHVFLDIFSEPQKNTYENQAIDEKHGFPLYCVDFLCRKRVNQPYKYTI